MVSPRLIVFLFSMEHVTCLGMATPQNALFIRFKVGMGRSRFTVTMSFPDRWIYFELHCITLSSGHSALHGKTIQLDQVAFTHFKCSLALFIIVLIQPSIDGHIFTLV